MSIAHLLHSRTNQEITALRALFQAMRGIGSSEFAKQQNLLSSAISLLESMVIVPGDPTTTSPYLVTLLVGLDLPDTQERKVQANVATVASWCNQLGVMGIYTLVDWNQKVPRILLAM